MSSHRRASKPMSARSVVTAAPTASKKRAALPSVAIIGPGNWGSTLALALDAAGVSVREIVVRQKSRPKMQLANKVGARSSTFASARLDSEVVWLCTPDSAIAGTASALAARLQSKRGSENRHANAPPIVFHSSGALPSTELAALREIHASVASVHPLMTFPTRTRVTTARTSKPLAGVPFALEGDSRACRVARSLVRAVGGEPFAIQPASKTLYHAFGAFTSPLLVALLVAATETAAEAAGWPPEIARRRMRPIVERTIENFFSSGSSKSFSGPIARGDTGTVTRHLEEMQSHPKLAGIYRELSRFAAESLPGANPAAIRRILDRP